MDKMDRVTICFEKGILPRLDGVLRERGYKSRSQAISDFVRRALTKREWAANRDCAGVISLVYESGGSKIPGELEKLAVSGLAEIVSMQTSFLGGKTMTVIAVKGRPKELERLADAFRSLKGVKGGSFSIACAL